MDYCLVEFRDHRLEDDTINPSEKHQALFSDQAHPSTTSLKFNKNSKFPAPLP